MRIPSYDDLARSIPDISARDTFAHVRRILPAEGAPQAGPVEPIGSDAPSQLFACLRSTRDSPELRRASAASRAAAPGGGAPGAL